MPGALACRGLDDGGFAIHVEFELLGAHDLAGCGVFIVEADGQAMRTQHRVFGRRALGELQFGDGAVRVYGQAGGDRVDAGFLQPLGAPGLEITAGGLFQFAQQVGQGGVG